MRYKIIYLVVLLIFFAYTSKINAQKRESYTVRITVTDSLSKETIIGAALQMKSMGINAVTDMNGVATLVNVPRGQASIEISCLGYEKIVRNYNIIGNITTSVRLIETSLQLKEVSVVAKNSAAGAATSSTIGRQAIEHLQATNLGDLMQLLPGQLMQNSDLTSVKQLNFRTAGTTNDANNAFGASVVVDGIPESNNATLSDKIGNTTAGNGIDLRQMGTDNIESVEVIRGIPSAEYGDLTSGAVIVKSKSGKTPYEVRTKVNPTTINSSFGKGWSLGAKNGFLNTSFDYAQAWGDPRTKTRSFDRISASATYANTFFKKLRTKTKISVNSLIDFSGQDPDEIANGTFTTQKDFKIGISHEGKIALNLPLARTITYVAGVSLSDKQSTTSTFVTKTGIIPIISATETGYYDVPFQSMSYQASGGAISAPQSYFLKLSNSFGASIKKFAHQFNMGLEYRYETNKAQGYYNDNELLPLRPNSDGRPRPYYDIPALNQLSGYLEDNMNWKMLGMKFKLQAGLRYTHLQPGKEEQVWSLSPRLNASVQVNKWFDLRLGYGQNAKTPGLVHLYPEKTYADKLAADNTGASNPAERMLLYHTYVYDVQRTKGLKNSTNTKYEIGFDIKLNENQKLSVVGYWDNTPNGFSTLGKQFLYTSNVYKMGQGLINNLGAKPAIDWANPARVDTMWMSTGEYGNYNWALNKGVEFDVDLGRIEKWNTSFYFSGAYMETSSKTTLRTISTPKNRDLTLYPETNTTPFKYIYPAGQNINVNRRFSTQLRGVLNIPALRMVFSSSLQVIWYSYSGDLNRAMNPVAYVIPDVANNTLIEYPITQEMLNDENYKIKGLLLKDAKISGNDNPPNIMPPLMMMSSRLTKDISKMAGFSFYVNNTLFYQPWQSSNISTTPTEKNQGTFNFGMELYFKF
jgi:outer membrane receptor protein involved in Fe transport